MDAAAIQSALRTGGSALQAGNPRAALDALDPIVVAGVDHQQLWMIYGEAARLAGDRVRQQSAADKLLAADPAQPRALAWKGECCAADGERRAASAWYRAADRALDALPSQPASLVALSAEIRLRLAKLDAEFSAAIDAGLAARAIDRAQCSPSFAKSLAIMRGEEQTAMGLQRPSSYYYPDLPERRFYERNEFPWAAAVESAANIIRQELETAIAEPELFGPYLTHNADRPVTHRSALDNDMAWSALQLFNNGRVRDDIAARFPATHAAMEQVPLCRISARGPNVMFSLLQPGARIDPHHGAINTRLICHLPLIIPGAGALEVGGEARAWTQGQLVIFDDSVEHSAWNDATADRVVLIFDIWRPEVPETDRRAINALFETVDAYR